jgi:uncharacterized Zn finger protein
LKTLQFLVQGSAKDPYEVRFTLDGDNLSAFCTCPAGKGGQYCKHRFRILEGSTEGIVSGNTADVVTVAGWLPGTDLAAAMALLAEAERRLERAKKAVTEAKKHVALAMRL